MRIEVEQGRTEPQALFIARARLHVELAVWAARPPMLAGNDDQTQRGRQAQRDRTQHAFDAYLAEVDHHYGLGAPAGGTPA